MAKYIIKKATLEELDLVAQLFDQYRVFYEQASDFENGRRFIQARMKNNQSVIFLALEQDNIPLGFVQLYPSFSSVSMKKLWILNDLFMDPSARNRGIAKKLMETAKNFAIETGAKGIILETAVTNHQAKSLYESIRYKKDVHSDHYELTLD
ncbi:GNAT family N-acetyltransferase [Shimazuella kribbensis]|uniref:GNAT family N-acetyltransferase n=1 Tax=Shimazuella kribbensis TaxID=139808 RepID=UPI00048F9D60|nr:GNAT family N-acetyltransferase [Shimazuella kribbensis]